MDFPLLAVKNFSTWETLLFFAMVIPTVYAMVFGAPFVPTSMKQVRRMLEAAKLKKGMVVYDLGSGDGRLVHTAAKEHGAKAIGYEYSPFVWLWAKFLGLFWRSGAKLKFGNFWSKDISDADVIVCYLLPHSMKLMEEKLIPKLKKGTLIISHAFAIPDKKVWRKLPRVREEKLGPVWIYKVSAQAKARRHKARKTRALRAGISLVSKAI